MYYYYEVLGIILIPAIILSIYAQAKVSGNFHKYSNINASSGITASELVKRILNNYGLYDVKVVVNNGDALNNYYDPTKKIISLSREVYYSYSVSALGVACHEVGHALQYADNYFPIKLRNAIIPVCNFSSTILWPIVIIGLVFNLAYTSVGSIILYAGLILFGASVLFNLFTLPTEYNASNRAMKLLDSMMILENEELVGAKKVLSSAALTYVAALLVSFLNLLRFLLVFRKRD